MSGKLTWAHMEHLGIESRVDHAGGVGTIRLRNWTNNQLDVVGTFSLSQTDNVFSISGIDAANHVRGADMRVEINTKMVVVATFTPFGFQTWVDQVTVNVN